jgi:hypothetical protein
VVTGWLLQWMRHHFSELSYIENQNTALSRCIWSNDCQTTGIAIEPNTKWSPELTESRPGIIIKRNAWKRRRLGIDDRWIPGPPSGNNSYTNLWQGSHTLFCVATEGAEAENLATEVFRELNEFGPIIREILDLKRFEVIEVGAVLQIAGRAKENFAVPVSCAYTYEESWTVTVNADVLNTTLLLSDFLP